MEIKLKIEATGLEKAIHALAKAMSSSSVSEKPAVQEVEPRPEVDTFKAEDTGEKEAQPETKAEPEPEPEPEISIETVRMELGKFSKDGRQSEAVAILKEFDESNRPKLSNIDPSQYPALLERARELL